MSTTTEEAKANVGLAFGLVIAAGLSTTIGAAVVFFSSIMVRANKQVLAISLGFSAGTSTVPVTSILQLTFWLLHISILNSQTLTFFHIPCITYIHTLHTYIAHIYCARCNAVRVHDRDLSEVCGFVRRRGVQGRARVLAGDVVLFRRHCPRMVTRQAHSLHRRKGNKPITHSPLQNIAHKLAHSQKVRWW